jgi:NAD(P)-dependent dehydrogenase (short-subunit alcohol dehydrogenase family)
MYLAETVRRLGAEHPVTLNAVHPGVVGTKLLEAAFGSIPQRSVEDGAATLVRLALDHGLASTTGMFFIEDKPRAVTGPAADTGTSRALYQLTCRQLGVAGLPEVE